MTDPTDPVEPTADVRTEGQRPEETTPDQGSSPSGEAPAQEGVEEPSEAETPDQADPLAEAQRALADRTADLQRLQAEFVNYKRRVDRDRELVRENATFAVLTPIIEVLDTIDRAREHGELEGGFKAVAEQLERVVAGLGLTRFAQPGDAFDPTVHEALSHIGTDPEVTVTTCQHIAKAGYKIGDRVVRAAQVLVVDPAAPETAETESAETESAETESAG